MFSIRKNGILLMAIASVASVAGMGCSLVQVPTVVATVEPVGEQPKADEATELRAFPKSEAKYQSGATEAWPTRWYYEPNPDYPTPYHFIADPIMFLFQTASLPETLRIEPPFRRDENGRLQPVVYAGDSLPPSYNAMPPLRPVPANSRLMPDPDPLSAPRPPVAPPFVPIPEEHPPLILPPKPVKAKPAVRMVAPTTRPVH